MKHVAFLRSRLLLHQYHLLQRQNIGAGNQLYPFFNKLDHRRATPCSKSPYFSIKSNMSAGNVNPLNVSVPEYLSPSIPRTPAVLIKPLSFLPLRRSSQQNWPSILSPFFTFSLPKSSLRNRIFIELVMLVAHLNHHLSLVTLKQIWVDAIREL